MNYLPLTNSQTITTLWVEGYANEKNQLVEERRITSDYLSAMQTPLLKGHSFGNDASKGPPVAIVNEAFAKNYLGGRESIRSHLRTNTNNPWTTTIGVAEDVRNESLETTAVPQIYTPFLEASQMSYDRSAYIAVR